MITLLPEVGYLAETPLAMSGSANLSLSSALRFATFAEGPPPPCFLLGPFRETGLSGSYSKSDSLRRSHCQLVFLSLSEPCKAGSRQQVADRKPRIGLEGPIIDHRRRAAPRRADSHVRIQIQVHRLRGLFEPVLVVILLLHLVLRLFDRFGQSDPLFQFGHEPGVDGQVG
jgi:hypothetical protein